MSASEQFVIAWLSFRRTVADLGRAPLWAPWLLLGLLQAAAVGAMWWFAHPWISWLAAPLLARVAGEDVLHYPRVLAILPRLQARTDLIIGALFGALAIGAATHMFAARYRGQEPSPGAAAALVLRRGPALVLAQLPLNALLFLLGVALERLAATPASATKGMLLSAAAWTLPVLLQSCFLFVAPLVVIEGRGAFAALRELPGVWRRSFWAAVLLGAMLLVPLVPFQLLAAGAGTIVARGDPDLVGWLTLAQVFVGLIVGFVLSGSSALYYLSGLAEREA